MDNKRCSKALSPEEIRRRKKILRRASASCAIEGLTLSKENLKVVEELVLTCETPDEMVERFKKHMGIEV